MSNRKSDKPFTLRVIIACILAIAIVYILLATFSHQVGGNFHNAVYVTGVIVFGALFFLQSFRAYQLADDGGVKDNSSRLYAILLAVAIIIWAGAWVAGSNEKVAPGSPQMEDVEKAKQGSKVDLKGSTDGVYNQELFDVSPEQNYFKSYEYRFTKIETESKRLISFSVVHDTAGKTTAYLDYYGKRIYFDKRTINYADNGKFLAYILGCKSRNENAPFNNCEFKIKPHGSSFIICDFQIKGEQL
jgi:hypothetical protein